MILLAQDHLTEKNICKLVSAKQFPGSYSLVQEDYYPSILNYSANFNILKQISSGLIQGTSLTLHL